MTKTIPDYVHQHFAKHPDEPVRPQIKCADGYSLSVQASRCHYCSPREDKAERYSLVEVGFPRQPSGAPSRPTSLGKFTDGVEGWVPVDAINRLIHRHGGIQG